MRLTISLLAVIFKRKKNTPGNVTIGANQKYKPIKTSQKMLAVNYLMMEEQNNTYLNNPYLSNYEEAQYGKAHPQKYQKAKDFFASRKSKFYSDRTLEDHIEDNLGKHRKWE
ncbi:uncharacterized protein LOC128232202 [Mya arenaria]|uniref:uncharacterized protein LOC128232202 n=1 Tax=Mya arenaria TaxID=6604 RepID=UPI0022E884FB|nr:uncharacterized protein LOC128232202 [Mya arenaria]